MKNHGAPNPNPLSGPRKEERDLAIERATKLARSTGEAHAVTMDRRGDYRVVVAHQAPHGAEVAVAYPNGTVTYTQWKLRASAGYPKPARGPRHFVDPRQTRARARGRAFRIGQDVEMISNPSNMGHIVGFDPDGSVMVRWTNPPGGAISGVSPDNLRGLPPGFAEARKGRTGMRASRRMHNDDEMWIDDEYSEAPFLAQRWYSGQGDPLYALASAGLPQPESTVEWALSNARASETEQEEHMLEKYGAERWGELVNIDPESSEARDLDEDEREDIETSEEIMRLVYALEDVLKRGKRISKDEGRRRHRR